MVSDGNTKRVTMNLPKELVSKLDIVAKVLFKNRTEVTKEAIREFVEEFEIDGGVREIAIKDYLDGNLAFDELEAILGPYDAKAVETSKSIYDKGEDLAEDIAKDL